MEGILKNMPMYFCHTRGVSLIVYKVFSRISRYLENNIRKKCCRMLTFAYSLLLYYNIGQLTYLGGKKFSFQTTVYGDMFFYNITKREWTVMKAPGAPPPRCSHQAIATATQGGELWVFGGEFSSPSESQFYHYRDLWVFRLAEKKWQKMRCV